MKKALSVIAIMLVAICVLSSCNVFGNAAGKNPFDGKTPAELYSQAVSKYNSCKDQGIPCAVSVVWTTEDNSVTFDIAYEGDSFSYEITTSEGDQSLKEETVYHGGKMYHKDGKGNKKVYDSDREKAEKSLNEDSEFRHVSPVMPHTLPESWLRDLEFVAVGEEGYQIEFDIDEKKSKEHLKHSDFFVNGTKCKIYFTLDGILDKIELTDVRAGGKNSKVTATFNWNFEGISEPEDKEQYIHSGKFDSDKEHNPDDGFVENTPCNPCIPGETDYVNWIEPTCTESGVYEAVVYCMNCGFELSREYYELEPINHANVHTEIENEFPATCIDPGSYEEVTYCWDCGIEVSREFKTTNTTSHTLADGVLEVETPSTCIEHGSYDIIQYCSHCGTELGRTSKELPLADHTYDDKYDESCNYCGHIRDAECAHSKQETIPAKESTCTEAGLTAGKKCAKCGEILVAQQPTALKSHTATSPVTENRVEPTCTETGSYDSVVYCEVCGLEISRVTSVIPKNEHQKDKDTCIVCGQYVDSIGLNFRLSSDGTYYIFVGMGSCTDDYVVIPSIYKDLPVKEIDAYLNNNIVTVVIPDGVVSIGEKTFERINSLIAFKVDDNNSEYKSIDGNLYSKDGKTLIKYPIGKTNTSLTIPDGVTTIGKESFKGCKNLTDIVIPASVTDIDGYAFYGCTSIKNLYISDLAAWCNIDFDHFSNPMWYNGENLYLNDCLVTELVIPNGVTHIGQYKFNGIDSIKNVVIPGSVTSIERQAFSNCRGIVSIEIPDSVTSIGDSAFYGCTSLTSLVIPNSVTSLSESVFYNCTALESLTLPFVPAPIFVHMFLYSNDNADIPESLNTLVINGGSISSKMFSRCVSIENVTIGDGVTSIGEQAFSSCTALKNLVIGDNVTTINDYAFAYCNSLESVTFGKGIKVLGSNAFNGCNSIEKVCISDVATWCEITLNGYSSSPMAHGADLYLNGAIVNKLVIPDGITNIDAMRFMGCESIKSITIPNSVTSIGDSAFCGCISLTDLVIPDNITRIDEFAFGNCTALENIELPDTDISIGSAAFKSTAYYDNIENWENNILYIGKHLVYADNNAAGTSVREYTVKEGTLTIADNAFYSYTRLNSLVIPDSVVKIGERALVCSTLSHIEVSENNANFKSVDGNLYSKDGKTLVMYAVAKTNTTFTIPDSVTHIGEGAFDSCKSLTEVVIPDTVLSIGSNAFRFCSITSVVIPNSVTAIDENAFYYCSSLTSVVIPDSVKSISDYAFYGCSSLTSIVIPSSVKTIGDHAFYGCSSLISVVIPNGVRSIEEGTFENCRSLTSIVIPSSVTSIGNSAFDDCDSLTSIVIPSSVTSIGDYAFSNCSALTSVIVPNSVKTIGNSVFEYCTSLTSVVIPDSVISIGNSAFRRCLSLKSIVLSNGITSISPYLFYECRLLADVTIPNGVNSIGEYAFYGCTDITSIEIPESIEKINDSAFEKCYNLVEVINKSSLTISTGGSSYGDVGHYALVVHDDESQIVNVNDYLFITHQNTYYLVGYVGEGTELVLPENYNGESYQIYKYAFAHNNRIKSIEISNGVTYIGESAFSNCSAMKKVTFPCTERCGIDYSAFYECTSLEEVYISDISSWFNLNFANVYSTPTFYGVDLYVGNKLVTELVIPDGVTSIGKYRFYNCDSIISVVLPDGFSYIGEASFYDCDKLESITLPGSVTYIGKQAFEGCGSLKGIEIPEGVTTIHENAFKECYSLRHVVLPSTITKIGNQAFRSCRLLNSIEIAEGVTSIGSEAFRYCTNLVEVVNNSSLEIVAGETTCGYVAYNAMEVHTGDSKVVNIDGYQFYSFEGENYLISYSGDDTSLVLPPNYNGEQYQIYQYAFYRCPFITSVVIPDGVTSIGDYAFYYCASLVSAIIEEGVTRIGTEAFIYCYSLKELSIPESVTEIAHGAFDHCESLESVVIPSGLAVIAQHVFNGCSLLVSIYIPQSVTNIDSYAFGGCTALKDVYYAGSSSEWSNLVRYVNYDSPIRKATIHYNYVPEE